MISGANRIRFGGMASGMDTEGIVNQLMKTERLKMERLVQKKTYRSWQQEAYREMNRSMANYLIDSRKKMGLEVDYFGNVKPDSKDKMKWLKTATSSNEAAFTVDASASSMVGNYQIEIKSLAKSAAVSSSSDTGFVAGSKLSEVMSIGETDVIAIEINGKQVQFTGSDNLKEVARKIKQETGIQANFDSGSKRLFLNTTKTGSESKITFGSDAQTASFLSAMAIQNAAGTSFSGENAKIRLNGGTEIEYQSNNIELNGLNITLKKTTSGAENIDVSLDVDGAYKKVKNFIEDYNKMIDTMMKKTAEEKYRDYAPLTAEQKAEMKDSDIKLWEEKARSGLLRKDQAIEEILQRMRSGVYEKVDGGSAAYSIGITTGNYKDGGKLNIDEQKFKKALQEDPDKVMQTLFGASALSKEEIYKDDTPAIRAQKMENNRKRDAQNGIFVRSFDYMTEGMEKIIDKSGPGDDSALLRNVKGTILKRYATLRGSKNEIDIDMQFIAKRVDDEQRRLSSIETRYWKRFTEMEKAIQQMQSQSGWLSQQFGGAR